MFTYFWSEVATHHALVRCVVRIVLFAGVFHEVGGSIEPRMVQLLNFIERCFLCHLVVAVVGVY